MRHVHITLIAPAILSIGLPVDGLATEPYIAAKRLDADTHLRQERPVERNVDVRISEVEYLLTS